MRIIAGEYRGRRIAAPPGRETRPTSDFVREAAFNLVGSVAGASVLDLYAGSGAIGLEALSRGAVRVLFVESDGRAARVIRANLAAVALPGGELICCQVQRFLDRGPGAEAAFDLVVADPPYAAPAAEVTGMLTALASGGWLAPEALVAVERATRAGPLPWPAGYRADRSRRYGEATFWYGLAAAEVS